MRQATASLRLNWFASTQNGPACPSNAWRTMSASKNSRLASCAPAVWADARPTDRTRTDHVIEARMAPSGLSASIRIQLGLPGNKIGWPGRPSTGLFAAPTGEALQRRVRYRIAPRVGNLRAPSALVDEVPPDGIADRQNLCHGARVQPGRDRAGGGADPLRPRAGSG